MPARASDRGAEPPGAVGGQDAAGRRWRGIIPRPRRILGGDDDRHEDRSTAPPDATGTPAVSAPPAAMMRATLSLQVGEVDVAPVAQLASNAAPLSGVARSTVADRRHAALLARTMSISAQLPPRQVVGEAGHGMTAFRLSTPSTATRTTRHRCDPYAGR